MLDCNDIIDTIENYYNKYKLIMTDVCNNQYKYIEMKMNTIPVSYFDKEKYFNELLILDKNINKDIIESKECIKNINNYTLNIKNEINRHQQAILSYRNVLDKYLLFNVCSSFVVCISLIIIKNKKNKL